MTAIRAFGTNIEVESADYDALTTACTNLLDTHSCRVSEIWRPTEAELPCTNQGSGNLLLLLTDVDRVIALKRCRGSQPKLDRELFVAGLRRRFNLNDYPMARQEGLVIRDAGSESNLPEIRGWERTPLLLIDFGARGTRFRRQGKH